MNGSWRSKLIIVFCAGLVARLAVLAWLLWSVGESAIVFGDTTRYMTLAYNTLSGAGYVYDGILDTFRLPGYPAFFMLLRLLHLPLFVGSLVQIVIGSGISVWVLWFAHMRLGLSERVSFVVALIAALEPIQVYYSVILLPDVFFAIAFLVFFTYALKWLDTYRMEYAAIAALAIGVGNYIRPAMVYLPIFVVAGLGIAVLVRRVPVRQASMAALIAVAIPFLVLSPWYLRNAIQFGHFALQSTAHYTVFIYDAAATEAAYRGVAYDTVKKEYLERARAEAPDKDTASFDNEPYFSAQTQKVLRAHPFVFLRIYALGLTTYWTIGNYQYQFKAMGLLAPPSQSISYTMLLGSKGPVVAVRTFLSKITEPFILVALFDRILWGSIFVLSMIGLFLKRRGPEAWLTLFVFAYFSATVAAAIIGVEARHRYALIPLILAFAVTAAMAAFKRISRTIRTT